MHVLQVIVFIIALAVLPISYSFVHMNKSGRRCHILGAIASTPLEQVKLDFVGSLLDGYDLNPTNEATTSFISRLVDQVTPETITRDVIESFEELGQGKWRIVYIEDYSTSMGFGSLFGDLIAGSVELENDGSILCKIQCSNPTPYKLSIRGRYGTARNNLLIKVSDVHSKQLLQSEDMNNGLLGELKGVPVSITQSILEKNWSKIFAGVVTIDLAYIDENLAVFDLDLLARVKGKRICMRKEPDFF